MDNLTEGMRHNAFIIDDETDICFLLSNVLKQKGIFSECAFTLKDAATALKGKNPEIIFLDNHLPDGLGLNFIKQIKQEHPSSKVIMVTAHDMKADREKAMEQGADYFIGKPLSREIINNVVDSFIN